jgi:gliding motility-associated-like protein
MELNLSMTKINRYRKTGIVLIFLTAMLFSGFTLHAQKDIQTPVLDSISIDGDVPILAWFPNTDNTQGYGIIHHQWNGSTFIWEVIDTVFGINQTSYRDESVSACEASQWYRIFAYGAGVNNNSLWSDTLKTILLEPPLLDICENSIFLQWSAYENMIPNLAGYQVFASESDGPFFEVAATQPGRTFYRFRNLAQNTLYSFKIRAYNADKSRTSTSCELTLKSYTPKQPEHIFIRYATVEDNEHIKIEWVADETAPISKFKILRSDDGITFDTLSEITDLTNYNPAKVYIDQFADFNSQSYYYQIRACDSCGVDTLASANIAQTIFLTGYPSLTGTQNQLEWNTYGGWDGTGIQEYNIYRKVDDGQYLPLPINPLPGNTTSYIDEVSNQSNLKGTFSYYVEAIENNGSNGYEDFKDQSLSNEVTIEQQTTVLIPNAFGPNLVPPDNTFKPLMAFIDLEGYQLSIFNKWGQQLFNTTDPEGYWDGKFNGDYVPTDAYVYLIVYRTPEGQTIEKRGTVTVLR